MGARRCLWFYLFNIFKQFLTHGPLTRDGGLRRVGWTCTPNETCTRLSGFRVLRPGYLQEARDVPSKQTERHTDVPVPGPRARPGESGHSAGPRRSGVRLNTTRPPSAPRPRLYTREDPYGPEVSATPPSLPDTCRCFYRICFNCYF